MFWKVLELLFADILDVDSLRRRDEKVGLMAESGIFRAILELMRFIGRMLARAQMPASRELQRRSYRLLQAVNVRMMRDYRVLQSDRDRP